MRQLTEIEIDRIDREARRRMPEEEPPSWVEVALFWAFVVAAFAFVVLAGTVIAVSIP